MGLCYYSGDGVTKSPEEAVKWWSKAADQGLAEAQYILGYCYVNGEGVTQNFEEGVKWLRKAAKQGDADAKEALEQLGETAN
ncbi:MAG: sel1 repeat family protein [Prevotellaceae bacterium]|nr:sel1 repeat family protein [Prevotellaceae bacterium]